MKDGWIPITAMHPWRAQSTSDLIPDVSGLLLRSASRAPNPMTVSDEQEEED